MRLTKFATVLSLLALTSGCAEAVRVERPNTVPNAPQLAAVKRITAAIGSNPSALSTHITLYQAGTEEIEGLTRGALTVGDWQGNLVLELAEVVPSIENGLWKLFPDGRMETTWQIRPGAFWHDGTAFTADDLVFTVDVMRDKEFPVFSDPAYGQIDRAEGPDPRTITVSWKQPTIRADRMFSMAVSNRLALPLPRHLLEQTFREDKANLLQLPYWTEELVGAGPYRVKQFARGTSLTLAAFDQYVLGRPRVDQIQVQFIPDPNAMMASLLAGTIELTLGRNLSFEQGLQLADQWREGRIDFGFQSWINIYPQFTDPNPAVIGDVRFRRGLIHALNRQEMVDTLMAGRSSVANSILSSDAPEYSDLDPAIVRYGYDPRQAGALLDDLGYRRGPDGMYADAAGQPLGFEIRAGGAVDYQTKPMFAASDYWHRLGINVETVIVPEQRIRDLEYRSTYPGFELVQGSGDFDQIATLQSSRIPRRENNFQVAAGKNYARYSSTELDALIPQYYATIPRGPRIEIARQIIHHITDQVVWMGLYYSPLVTAIGQRLENVAGRKTTRGSSGWNAQDWDLS